jgi:hypothetical protein
MRLFSANASPLHNKEMELSKRGATASAAIVYTEAGAALRSSFPWR